MSWTRRGMYQLRQLYKQAYCRISFRCVIR